MQRANSTSSALKLFGAAILALTLAACGSSDSDSSRRNNIIDGAMPSPGSGADTGGDTKPGDPDNPNDDPASDSAVPAELGIMAGDEFQAGKIATELDEGALLAAGGQVRLTVDLVYEGELVAQDATVHFVSDCLRNERASLWANASAGNAEGDGPLGDHSVTTSWGTATVWYKAGTCTGNDTVTARAMYNDIPAVQASTTIDIAPDTLDNIVFVDATPGIIRIANMSGVTTSDIRFQTIGRDSKQPIPGVEVEFALDTSLGDVKLLSSSAVSDENGYVTATVRSGNAAGVVSVTAKTDDNVWAPSSQLVIATGIPVQGRSSLSIEQPHLAAWSVDGVETSVSMRLADQNGNNVPAGTMVYFTSSAGRIDDSCAVDENSSCSVAWNSQGNRPLGSGGAHINTDGTVTCPGAEECRAGRVQVVATTHGNESFWDSNGNGLYDPDVDIFATGGNCDANAPQSYIPPMNESDACDDLGEAYLDTNFNGVRDPEERVIADLNNSSAFDGRNGIYNGILCPSAESDAGNCSRETVTIRSQGTIVMASSSPYLPIPGLPTTLSVPAGTTQTLDLVIADENGNGMPPGTTISVNDNLANNVSFNLSRDEIQSERDMGPTIVSLAIEASDTDAASGRFEVNITSGGSRTLIPVHFN